MKYKLSCFLIGSELWLADNPQEVAQLNDKQKLHIVLFVISQTKQQRKLRCIHSLLQENLWAFICVVPAVHIELITLNITT